MLVAEAGDEGEGSGRGEGEGSLSDGIFWREGKKEEDDGANVVVRKERDVGSPDGRLLGGLPKNKKPGVRIGIDGDATAALPRGSAAPRTARVRRRGPRRGSRRAGTHSRLRSSASASSQESSPPRARRRVGAARSARAADRGPSRRRQVSGEASRARAREPRDGAMALAAAEMATMGGGAMMGELGRAREDGAAGESGEGGGRRGGPIER